MWVTNNSEHDLEDGYDGKRYLFAKGQSVDVPLVVCHHVFGYGDDKKEPYLRRLGWMASNQDLQKALARLHSFSFSSEQPKPNVHVLSPVVDSTPVLVPNKRKAGLVQVA
jgi:hypothetical protein